jgi:hypothetical protein
MMNNMTDIIEQLKKGAVGRCRERIIDAQGKVKVKVNEVKKSCQNHGVTSHLKKMRGL